MEKLKKEALNKEDALKYMLESGLPLIQKKYPDFGTTSFTKPIKRTNKFTSTFTIGDKKVTPKSGYAIIQKIEMFENSVRSRSGLVEIITWNLKK